MKKTTFIYGKTLIILLLSSLLFAVILSSIHQANLIVGKNYEITTLIVSLLLFFISGLFLGFNVKKHGILHALMFSSIYISVYFLIIFLGLEQKIDINQILIISSKFVILIIGSIIGRNLKG